MTRPRKFNDAPTGGQGGNAPGNVPAGGRERRDLIDRLAKAGMDMTLLDKAPDDLLAEIARAVLGPARERQRAGFKEDYAAVKRFADEHAADLQKLKITPAAFVRNWIQSGRPARDILGDANG